MQVPGHTIGSLISHHGWNHALRVHLNEMLKSDAALVWLPVHVGDDIIVHSVTIDKTLLGCFNLLVALA